MNTLTSDGRFEAAADFSLRRIGMPSVSGRKSWYAKSMKGAMVGDMIVKRTTPTNAAGGRWSWVSRWQGTP